MNLFELFATITLDTSGYDKGLQNVKKSSAEYRSDVMKLAQTYKKQGMDMSEAMKKAYAEIDKSQYETAENSKSDAKKFAQNWENAGKNISDVADKIKSGLATAAKVGTAAITAAATGIVALTKASVQNYAEYEQLVGGVETLFGTGGKSIQEYALSVGKSVEEVQNEYDKLAASQQKVLDNAANAYRTAGMSANEYMETVTSFSASLLQSLDGDTEAAAEYANMAITDMSDNANKMGTSMEMIQNAYNGFAKQNYTMLDNLKLGYGGTKEEMQRLLERAEELSGFEYDISSYADIVQAIHVVQDEMGITGTTAAEASQTISGSLASAKAAWSNLVTGVADDNADMGQLIDNFVGSVGTAFENLLPRIKVVFGKLGEIAKQGFTAIYNKFREFMDNCGILDEFDAIVAGITTAFTKVKNVFTTVWNKANEVFPKVKKSVTDSFDRIKEVLQPAIDFLGNIIEKIKEYFESGEAAEDITNTLSSVIEFLGNGLSALSDFLATVVEKIASFVTWLSEGSTGADILLSVITGLTAALIAHEVATKAVTAATLIMEGAQKAITVAQAALNAVMNANPFVLIATLIAGVVTALITLWNTNEDFRNAVIKIWDGIKNAFSTAWDFIKNVFGTVGDFFSGVWNNIKNAFANVGDWFGKKFSNAKEKVISAWDNIKEAFENIWENIKDAFSGVGIWFTQTFTTARDAAVVVWGNVKTTFLDIWENIKSVFSDAFDVGKDIVDNIWDGITGAWDTVVKGVQGLWERFKATITGTDDTVSVAVDGSHYTGLDYVPYDGYIAELHRGEMVLTADEARGYDKGKFGSTVNITENIYVQGNYDDAAQRKNNARLANTLAR